MDLQQKNGCDSSFEDQLFLLNFIMGTYLGPDITDADQKRCAFQRLSEDGVPSYVSTDLGPSYVSVAMLENLYYFLLRNAHFSLTLKPGMFHEYLKGRLCKETRQFTSFFPLDLHKQIWYPASFRIVKGIVLIEDPDPSTSRIEERDLEKFRALAHVGSLKIDMDEFVNFEHENQIGVRGSAAETLRGQKRSREKKCVPESEVSIIVSGSAKKGKPGPAVGMVDVGFSKAAYYFRVALPGVRKNFCKFSCEIESEGKVHIRGSTRGGETIKKPLRVFEMKFRQLCPPGSFAQSFSLPGPVDPRLFAPNFRSDGIFEGVVIKRGS